MQRMFRCLRTWRSEQGSNVVQAAAVALVAATLIAVMITIGSASLRPAAERAFNCLVAAISGGGAGCGGGPASAEGPGATTPTSDGGDRGGEDDGGGGLGGWFSAGIDFIPVVGEIKGLIEVFTGTDLVTGEDLGAWRWAGLAGLIGLNEIKQLRHADEVVDTVGDLARRGDDVADAGSNAGRRLEDCFGAAPGRRGPGLAAPLQADCLVPGTPAHKQQRWEEYQARGGTWSYDRWSKTYEVNLQQARQAHQAAEAYRRQIGWGQSEVTVRVDDQGTTRRLDIGDPDALRGIEYKTGYITYDEAIRSEVARDAALVQQGWDIQWVFEGRASQPLLDALREAGIPVIMR